MPAARDVTEGPPCMTCRRRNENCIMPEVGAACMQCKFRKVRCSLSLGRKRGSEWILDSGEEETGSNDQPKVKRPKTTGLRPSAGPVSVQVPERTSSVLD